MPAETRAKLIDALHKIPLPRDIPEADTLYHSTLSICPGTKVGGYPRAVETATIAKCASCGRAMEYLLTATSDEFDGASYVRWLPVEERHLWDGTALATYGWADAPGLQFGDLGSVEFFVCKQCAGWPVGHYCNAG
jgi:hypothetical protein